MRHDSECTAAARPRGPKSLHPRGAGVRFGRALPQAALLAALVAPAAKPQDVTLSTGKPEEVGLSAAVLAGGVALYREAVERGDLVGAVLLVARNGKVVLHEAVGWRDRDANLPMEKNTMFRMASNTKPVIATAVATLVEKGLLRYDDHVRQYIPSFDNYRSGFIQVRHLLTHTSGLRIPTLFLQPYLERSSKQPNAPSLQLEVARFGEVGAAVVPGSSYSYSNPGYNTLGALIELRAGKPLEVVLREEIYQPLGMVDSYHHEVAEKLDNKLSRMGAVYYERKDGRWVPGWKPGDPPQVPFVRASGGMISTAWDYAIFCQMYLNGGIYKREADPEARNHRRHHQPADQADGDSAGPERGRPGGVSERVWLRLVGERGRDLLSRRVGRHLCLGRSHPEADWAGVHPDSTGSEPAGAVPTTRGAGLQHRGSAAGGPVRGHRCIGLQFRLGLVAAAAAGAATSAAPSWRLAAMAAAQEPMDLVIRGGRLLDGSSSWIRADVGVRGDRIVAVGDLSRAAAARVIDARDRYVTPGFIDVHSHAGPGLETAGLAAGEPLLAQGITTVVVNPDGGGPVDLVAQRRRLASNPLGVNVALLVPHGSIRREVVGMADRAPTAAELERMKAMVRAGMDAGAFGLSSGPYYAPGSFAKAEELVALAREAAVAGGVYTSHIRDESDYTVGLLAAIDEVITIAEAARLPGIVTHVKALGPNVWGFSTPAIRRIERARARGIEVFADQYPYDASSTGLSAALVPRWAEAGGDTAMRRRLDDPKERDRLRAEMAENLVRRGGPDRQMISRHREDPSLEGKNLAQIANARGVTPLDAAIQILKAGGAGIVSFNMDEGDIDAFMRQPWTMTCSDGTLVPINEGVPHPRAYGTFPRKLARYVRDRGVIPLELAIRSMTSLPAAVFRMGDRGTVRVGAKADLVVFDLERLDEAATYERPHQLASGMAYVVVNGQVALEDGRATGKRAGMVLDRRRPN